VILTSFLASVIFFHMHLPQRLAPFWLLLVLMAASTACNVVKGLPVFATATPTVTPTPTLTPTPTATPTPTPTPTPLPEVRVAAGDQAIFNGDWDTALREYQAAYDTSLAAGPDALPEIRTAALLGLGHTRFLSGDYQAAQGTLQSLIDDYPDSTHLSEAYFFLAQTDQALGQNLEASDAYLNYLALRPGVIDSYAYELRADALAAAGKYAEAITDYQAASQAPRAARDFSLDIKTARAYAYSGDYSTAIIGYQDIYQRSSNDYTKAQMDLYIGQAYTALGQDEQAYTAYLDAVTNYPFSYDSYSALVVLVDAGVPVDELLRGQVDYYAGQYGVALAAFDRYLQANPVYPATGHYFRGLCLRAQSNYAGAIDEWDSVIQGYPDSPYWDDAWEQKAYTQWAYLEQYSDATQTLLDFVTAVPLHARAAEFLFDAASDAERGANLNQAAQLWERVATDYPNSNYAYRALFLAGVTRYRLDDYVTAHDLFQRDLVYTTDLEQRAAAYLWSGKSLQALGDTPSARADWEQAAALDRTGYYSQRARDLLSGLDPFTPPQMYDFSMDPAAERAEAEQWMITVFALPPETDFSDPGSLGENPSFQRGSELWELGLYDQARAEFEDLRLAIQDDPVNSYRLANYLVGLGLYRSAIFAARNVLTLAGMDDAEALSAPIYFNHIRFGIYYRDLVVTAAQEYNFNPLFLFSLIRQESLFEGFASSAADARGLMQIIPSTGQEIAANSGWPPNYTTADLYRPLVSIELGSNYLNRQREFLGADDPAGSPVTLYASLAAYNGGPGNAAAWLKLAPDDPDLFLEVIRFDETRDYIRRIYEIFDIYRQLYDRTP
jgi:soluble lytic murein transglycosylase